ncbi:isoprenoid synthase domain-containing protein [Gautieria morchelliformis]|nr:isoprenoid synthase domain-containing protein [Gautieria morchelliformis]
MLPRAFRPPPSFTRLHAARLATSINSGGAENPSAYCKSLVQKHDYESYLCSQFYPHSSQPGYFALKAFFLELAMVQENVSTLVMGKMRFQFWRDAITGIAENRPPRHPIALALHEAAKSANLQRYHLKRIIDAREEELSNPSHRTIESLASHAESTYSTLLYLLLSLLNLPDTSGTLSHAASHLGVAQCIAVLLRALPYHASRGHLVIPADVAAKHGLRQEEVFRRIREGRHGAVHIKGLDDSVYEFAVAANDQILTARSMFEKQNLMVPREAMPVFLAGIPASGYLTRLEKVNFDALHPTLQMRDWKLPWRIWRGYYKHVF